MKRTSIFWIKFQKWSTSGKEGADGDAFARDGVAVTIWAI